MDLKDFTENEQEEIEKNEQIYFKTISLNLVCIKQLYQDSPTMEFLNRLDSSRSL